MAVGGLCACSIEKNGIKHKLFKWYLRLFGTLDLHTHMRWNAIKDHIEPSENTVEIGGGWGVMSFEYIKLTGKPVTIVEPDKKSIELGRKIAKNCGIKGIKFIDDSLPKLEKFLNTSLCYDQVLLIDVLEHIKEDSEALKSINKLLKIGGYLIISVPTPNYPKYFGHEFANKIGHVRDGYRIEELQQLLSSAGFEIVSWRFHTNLFVRYLCSVWYKYNPPLLVKLVIFPFLKIASKLDIVGSEKISCGLIVKAKK